MDEQVLVRVKRVVAETLEIDAESIADTARFVEDLGAQSIQSVELVAAFEEEFDIDMDDDEALGVKTVDGAVAFIAAAVETQYGES
ncbi:acyl carrier protein [Pirellulales bacterium]|nr:acyl carrier protein [Pirellulales bacterium]